MDDNNERAILDAEIFEDADLDLDTLEECLEAELEEQFADLDILQEEREHINNPDHLGETVMNVVWEQFMNQVAATAGKEFIGENGGLNLDLSSEAHILTAENFEHGKMPTHNPNKETYQQRYKEYRDDFQTNPNLEVKMSKNMRVRTINGTKTYERYDEKTKSYVGKTRYNKETGVWEDWDSRAGSWKKKLAPDARDKFDTRSKDQKGSASVAKDHTISAAEQIRDTEAAAYVDRETRKNFAKSDANLNDLDARANSSKGDSTMGEWLDSEKDGKKPSERFDIDEDALRKRDDEAREPYEKMKAEGKKRTIEEGKKSKREEAFRIGGKALRTALMAILAALAKEIIGKLVLWLKSAEKSVNTLIGYIKLAIQSFVGKLKDLLVSTSDSVITTIVTSIVGPVVGTIKKVFTLLKQGWKSLKEAVQFLRKPENRGKPLSYLLPQVGIIVVTGLSGIGAIVLGDLIEKGLTALLPPLGEDIPVLGSPANLIGMLMGAIVCGVIGAIAINLINKHIAKQQRNDNLDSQIDKKNEILNVQDKLLDVKVQKLSNTKSEAAQRMAEHRRQAAETISDSLSTIFFEEDEDDDISDRLSALQNDLEGLLD